MQKNPYTDRVNFKNLIREFARTESAISLSALLRSDTFENAIKAIQMRSTWQMQFAICLLRKIYTVWCVQKEKEITL